MFKPKPIVTAIALSLGNFAHADLNSGLVAYYPFNTNALDASGNGNNGTVYGATLTADRFGNANSAYYFNGNSSIDANNQNISFGPNQNFTVSIWVKITAGCSDTNYCGGIVSNMGVQSPIAGFQIGYHNVGVFRFEYAVNGYGKHFHGSKLINDNIWHNLCAIVDKINNKISLYVDGVADGEYSETWFNGTTQNINPLFFGRLRGNSAPYYYNGSIDDLRIYNRSLTASEIQELYQESTTQQLTITKTGTGDGTVISKPAGINCGATCSANFNTNTAVTLTATPATGNVFTNWNGDADCSDGQITMNTAKTCTAQFNLAIAPPAVSTDAPSVITSTSVKLTGTVNANNATTTVSFDFGLTNSYELPSIAAVPGTIAATAAATSVSADKAGLNCNTEYFYRVLARNSAGTSLGTERSFTTSTCPPVNAWLYPVNPTIIVDHDFTLDLHVDSHGVKVGSYDFQINFDQERLVVDDTQCDSGVCPGTDAVDTSTVVTDNDTGVIKVAGFDMDGVGPNNDLQLLVIHFKTKITPGPTLIDLTTNELATVLGEVIGLGSRDNLVTISPGICGDSDGNGAVNIVDALAIARRAVGLPPPPTVNTLWADVNQNQVTNITDAMLIARHSVGMLVVGTCNIGQALPF